MCDLVARTGRHQQRYEAGCRLVAGVNKIISVIRFGEIVIEAMIVGKLLKYESGLVRYKNSDETGDANSEKIIEVLMINSPSGPGLLFPKGGWENDETVEEAAVREAVEEAGVRGELMDFLGFYHFKSKTHQDEFSPEGVCRAAMFALFVKEELESWPEQSTRNRTWLTVAEAIVSCRHAWMREALQDGFSKWHAEKMISARKDVH
ncbi:nudix hydrolase 16 mitochondrial [Prunus yedoensis var. nudiflora]|uniref:Nudix hydrolase 16 mitochondrial n=1 Tax=Prunus yedoensis var. nudiflora TaxID=2094558 RepID=A0A314YLU5_PRUYE|nr:nudix hydrolase 16 mitochondrial [Prunus yedoensis var. nudiflora]